MCRFGTHPRCISYLLLHSEVPWILNAWTTNIHYLGHSLLALINLHGDCCFVVKEMGKEGGRNKGSWGSVPLLPTPTSAAGFMAWYWAQVKSADKMKRRSCQVQGICKILDLWRVSWGWSGSLIYRRFCVLIFAWGLSAVVSWWSQGIWPVGQVSIERALSSCESQLSAVSP
jgi:hypothetical protein